MLYGFCNGFFYEKGGGKISSSNCPGFLSDIFSCQSCPLSLSLSLSLSFSLPPFCSLSLSLSHPFFHSPSLSPSHFFTLSLSLSLPCFHSPSLSLSLSLSPSLLVTLPPFFPLSKHFFSTLTVRSVPRDLEKSLNLVQLALVTDQLAT